MKKIKYALKFVNKGKPFVISDWTVEKHERAIATALEFTKGRKDLNDTQKENELKYAIMYEALLEIDESVELDEVRKYFIHPENIVEFFNAVYYAGKKNIYFRQEEKPPKKRDSTSKKN
jgi:hypothetical protein